MHFTDNVIKYLIRPGYVLGTFLIFIIVSSLTSFYAEDSVAQSDNSFRKLLDYRGLSEEDITIPVNFEEDMALRAGYRLILPVVRDYMTMPLKSKSFPDTLLGYANLPADEFITKVFSLISFIPGKSDVYSFNLTSGNLPASLNKFYSGILKRKNSYSAFGKDEKEYLRQRVFSVLSEDQSEGPPDTDIFEYNRSRDSSIANSKKVIELLNIADKSSLYGNSFSDFVSLFRLYEQLKKKFPDGLKEDEFYSEDDEVDGYLCYLSNEGGLRIAIGSDGPNRYLGYFDMIIDPGGDDTYELSAPPSGFSRVPTCIIDLNGNDKYSAGSDLALASAYFGSSFIFDANGDDFYKGAGNSIASSVCGLAVVLDDGGNDIYRALSHSVGASTFGAGVLIDSEGNDVYIANSYSQGYGSTGGAGVICDKSGNDSYLVDSRSLDIGRYEDHYISMCQGYGNGVRPYYAGGIGLIIEVKGNDIYNADVFGQGGAYWFSLGCIADGGGNDKYNSYQYGQGAGIHLAVGILKDFDGWDFYSSNGVSQGCGHDYGFGILHDLKGNDNYSAYSLSQGAGNANGIGILLDEDGRDGYLNKEPGNTRGYGNSRREFGSLGLFTDASGIDFYSLPGRDSTYLLGSMWGGFLDEGIMPEPLTGTSAEGFKVPVDSSRDYSSADYLIMAKTIEPRFSLWKDFGFRKLADDSLNTSEFVLNYLDTDDHRVALVLRELALKIGFSMGSVFSRKLDHYLVSASAKPTMTPEQVSFICYLFGETGDPSGKKQLLDLTFDENQRIRGSAVNALGKLRVNPDDAEFTEAAAERLRGLSESNDGRKLFRKDLAFAFRKYKSPENIPVLLTMLEDGYFASRFVAAECLASYGELYYSFVDNELPGLMPSAKTAGIAFIHSLSDASDDLLLKFVRMANEGKFPVEYNAALLSILESRFDYSPGLRDNYPVIVLIENVRTESNLIPFRNE